MFCGGTPLTARAHLARLGASSQVAIRGVALDRREDFGLSGGAEGGRLLSLILGGVIVSVQDSRERLLGEVAARNQPLVAVLDQQHAGEADQARVVGEDANDIGAAAELAVDALERVRASELAPVLARKRVEAQQVRFGI